MSVCCCIGIIWLFIYWVGSGAWSCCPSVRPRIEIFYLFISVRRLKGVDKLLISYRITESSLRWWYDRTRRLIKINSSRLIFCTNQRACAPDTTIDIDRQAVRIILAIKTAGLHYILVYIYHIARRHYWVLNKTVSYYQTSLLIIHRIHHKIESAEAWPIPAFG